MTITVSDLEGELCESAAIVRTARDALPDIPNGNELVDTVSLLCAVEKRLELLAEAVQAIGAKQRGSLEISVDEFCGIASLIDGAIELLRDSESEKEVSAWRLLDMAKNRLDQSAKGGKA